MKSIYLMELHGHRDHRSLDCDSLALCPRALGSHTSISIHEAEVTCNLQNHNVYNAIQAGNLVKISLRSC